MISRVKKALEPKNVIQNLPTNLNSESSVNLKIATKRFKFKCDIVNDTILQKSTHLYFLYICRVLKDNRAAFIIDFTNTTTLADLMSLLTGELGGNEFSYVQHENNIFARDQEKIRDSLDYLLHQSFVFINSGACLILSIDDDLYYYNGESCFTIKVERIHVLYQTRSASIREYFQRDIMCKGCEKNVSTIMCIDDPILPPKDKDLCDECFQQLFLTKDGTLRYEGMGFERIKK